jgi:hypothetical protein
MESEPSKGYYQDIHDVDTCGRQLASNLPRKSMLKIFVDWLKNASVASFAVGMFQNQKIGLVFAVIFFVGSIHLVKYTEEKK